MQTSSISQLVPILQLSIGPVILISGVGLLLLTLTNRFGRMLDRSRAIIKEVRAGVETSAARANMNTQVKILHHRARLLRWSITLAAVTVLGAGVLILGLFVASFWHLELVAALVGVFCMAILTLIGSLGFFIQDMNLSLKAAELDWRLLESEKTD